MRNNNEDGIDTKVEAAYYCIKWTVVICAAVSVVLIVAQQIGWIQ